MTGTRAAAATLLAGLALTLAMAWPVARAPAERVYGHEVDGRHHDPYTVMWQFEHGPPALPHRQPLVDDVGGWLARAAEPVAAFNAVVLASFPLAALAAFALARYLRLSNGAAIVAALAFAFAAPHLAHAAYHPHIAQTQWIPLYFLAVWAALDRTSPARLALVVLAGATLALSNFYAAFIAAVLTPMAIGASWLAGRSPGRARRAGIVLGVLAAAGILALAAARAAAPALAESAASFAFSRVDLERYGARWQSYLLPPVDHALWGSLARDFWAAQGMTGAVVEQQLSLSWGLLVLAGVALWRWLRAPRDARIGNSNAALQAVPVLAAVAVTAAWCSLAPAPGAEGTALLVPATWLHTLAPMFRSYARFGIVTHLMVALLAGIGVMCLWRGSVSAHKATHRALAAGLLIVAAIECLPFPPRWHDVLPTSAHRWLAEREPSGRILDCVTPSQDALVVPWLMGRDVSALPPALWSCRQPGIARRAATRGYSYLIERRAPLPPRPEPESGLVLVYQAEDADIYKVVAERWPVAVSAMHGFWPVERTASAAWCWMGQQGAWTIRNVRGAGVSAALELDLSAYDIPRRVRVTLDGAEPQVIDVAPGRRTYQLNPWIVGPGEHRVTFTALEPAGRPAADPRPLTIMLHDWRWHERRVQ